MFSSAKLPPLSHNADKICSFMPSSAFSKIKFFYLCKSMTDFDFLQRLKSISHCGFLFIGTFEL